MKIEIYNIYRYFDSVNLAPPIMPDVLSLWSRRAGWQARKVMGKEGEVDYKTDAEVIALSVYTMSAKASYRVAAKMRALGKVVILGGSHFRGNNYREAIGRCDVVASGINEVEWRNILSDIEAGRLEPGGETRVVEDPKNLFRYPDDLHTAFSHKWYQAPNVPTSVGCPYSCDYCGPALTGAYIKREPEVIYQNMAAVKGRSVVIPDASFGLNKRHILETMEAVAPLKKNLYVTTSISRISDLEVLRAMGKGGVKAIAIGIESFSAKLPKHGSVDTREKLERLIGNCHDNGMMVQGNFIMGLDCDGPEVFGEVYDYSVNSALDHISADILLPYPHTPLFDQMKAQGRILHTDWDRYDYRHIVYRPKRLSVQEMARGFADFHNNIGKVSFLAKKLSQVYRRTRGGRELVVAAAYRSLRLLESKDKFRRFSSPIPPLEAMPTP